MISLAIFGVILGYGIIRNVKMQGHPQREISSLTIPIYSNPIWIQKHKSGIPYRKRSREEKSAPTTLGADLSSKSQDIF
jgi:hypothetical protein